MRPTPRLLQAALAFTGKGLLQPSALGDAATYRVPADRRAQLIYFRAGNSLDALVCVSLLRDGHLLRYFPIGAQASVHIPLAVIEDLEPESLLEVHLAAPDRAKGVIILDVGLVEID